MRLNLRFAFVLHWIALHCIAHPLRLRASEYRRKHPSLSTADQDRAVQWLLECRRNGTPAAEVLGIRGSPHAQDVRRRFRTLSLLVHPDKNPSEDAAEAFKILSQAYKAF